MMSRVPKGKRMYLPFLVCLNRMTSSCRYFPANDEILFLELTLPAHTLIAGYIFQTVFSCLGSRDLAQ